MSFQGPSKQVNHCFITHLWLVWGLIKTYRHQGQSEVLWMNTHKETIIFANLWQTTNQQRKSKTMLKGKNLNILTTLYRRYSHLFINIKHIQKYRVGQKYCACTVLITSWYFHWTFLFILFFSFYRYWEKNLGFFWGVVKIKGCWEKAPHSGWTEASIDGHWCLMEFVLPCATEHISSTCEMEHECCTSTFGPPCIKQTKQAQITAQAGINSTSETEFLASNHNLKSLNIVSWLLPRKNLINWKTIRF